MAKTVYCRKPLGKREAHIIKRLKKVAHMPITTIAKVTERNKTTIYDVLQGRATFAKRGPKQKLCRKDINHLVKTLRSMIWQAKARVEVTLAMLKKRAKIQADDKVVRKALLSKKIRFRRLCTKPLVTRKDRISRFDFAKKHRRKTRQFCLKHIQVHIDLKNFPVYTHAKARDVAAMREVRVLQIKLVIA